MTTLGRLQSIDARDDLHAKVTVPARESLPLRQGGFRAMFWSPYEHHRDRVGQPFTVLGLKEPGADHDPEEVGDLYRIRFGDGTVIDAWPEEVEPVT